MIVPLGTALTTTALHTPMSHENVTEKLIDNLTKHVYIWLKNYGSEIQWYPCISWNFVTLILLSALVNLLQKMAQTWIIHFDPM